MKKLISAILVITLAAAVVFAFAGCKKNPTKEFEDLRFIYEDIIEDDVLLEKYANDVHRYRDIIAEDFGLGEENTDNFYENFAEYYIYGMTVKTLNYTESDITILSVESDSNGKNGVYVRKSVNGAENGVEAKLPENDYFANAMTVHILCENVELSMAQVVETVMDMNLTVKYTDGTTEKELILKVEENIEITAAPSGDKVIALRGEEFGAKEALIDTYVSDKGTYSKTLADDFGMGKKGAEDFFANPDKYDAYTYAVSVENLSGHDIVIYDISPVKNGRNDVFVKVGFSGEMGIPKKSADAGYVLPPFMINVINGNTEKLDDEVLSTVDSIKFNITYAEKLVDGNADSEEVGERKTVEISIG